MYRLAQVCTSGLAILWARLTEKYRWHDELIKQCERLGGVYIKFIQMLAVHDSTKHLVRGISIDMAYEQVTYEAIDVRRELGKNVSNFASISNQPIAAGSYGQVYGARLQTGQEVIIKVLRPSVRKTLRADLRILNAVASIIGLFSKAAIVDVKAIMEEFARTTYAETDYLREVESGEWLRDYYNKRQTLVIPKSYRSLSSRHVLVQERIGGISLASAMSQQREGARIDEVVMQATGSNIWQQLDLFGAESLYAILYADYMTVDPHPGNVRLLPDNKVAMIDFGMMGNAPRNRASFVNMLGEYTKVYENRFNAGSFAVSMLAFYDNELHDALRIVARELGGDNYMQSIEGFVSSYMNAQGNDSLTQHYIIERRMSKLFEQVINQNNKLGIRISQDNIMLQRSMSMFLSIVRAIGEGHDGNVNFTLLHNISSRVYQDALKHGFNQAPAPQMSDERAYEVASNWLTLVAQKDRHLYKFITRGSYA